MKREIEAIYAIWLREVKIYMREKERIISSVINPLLWLFVFGGGLGASISIKGVNYQHFIFPGIIVMSTLFSSIFYGLYIIWDRRLDFLKEVLAAPISRFSIMAGKMLGGITDIIPQIVIVFTVGALFMSIRITFAIFLSTLLTSLLISASMVSLGLTIGANMKSPEGFSLIMSFVLWPLFFFSGALYPVENLPEWIRVATLIDPLTYGVDLMRGVILGMQKYPVAVDVLPLALFTAVMVAIGAASFGRMQQMK